MTETPLNREQFLARYRDVDAPESSIRVNSVLALCDAQDVPTGPLSDVAVLIKDNIEALGLPGTAGSLALKAHPATRDAELVTRLRAAGADIVGATNLSEWANIRSTRSASGWSAVGGLTGNPWQLDRSAGGSSSGAGAAVAAGLVSLAIGTETDGSIVCPASLNGVVGLKPTVGSISVDGVVPISKSQDTPGPLTTDVRLAALAFEVMSGKQGAVEAVDNSKTVSSKLRVGVADAWLTGHTETDAVFANAVEVVARLVASVDKSDVPAAGNEEHTDEYTVLKCELKDDLGAYLTQRLPNHSLNSLQAVVDFNNAHAEVELQHFGQEIFEAALTTQGRDGDEYREARKRNLEWAITKCFAPAFEKFDLLVAPAYGPAWKSDLIIGERGAGGVSTTAAAIAGYPLLCIPMGLVQDMPVGLIISGSAGDEARMLALGAELMKHLGTRPSDGYVPQLRLATRG